MSLKDYRLDLPYRDDYLVTGEFIHLDEIHKLYCERLGTGPHLVLLSGLTGDAAEMGPLAAELAREFATVCFDRRGYSRSPRAWSKTSMHEMALDVGRLLDALGMKSAFIIAASVAACVAIELARLAPQRVGGLILHEPWVAAGDRDRWSAEMQAGEIRVQQQRIRYNTGPFEARLRFLMGSTAFEALSTETRARVVKNREMHAVEGRLLAAWTPALSGVAQSRRLPRVVVSAGRESTPLLRDAARGAAAGLDAPLIEAPGMHAPYLDQAEAYAAIVRPWLSKWAAAGRSEA